MRKIIGGIVLIGIMVIGFIGINYEKNDNIIKIKPFILEWFKGDTSDVLKDTIKQ